MRWLNNKQALEDSARFVKEMQFPEADKNGANLTAPNSPVIYYGGSYPGARAEHMRVLYPDLIFGAIASSAVVAAIEEFPDYFYPITRGAQQDCVQAIQSSIGWIDSILAPEPWKGQAQANRDEYKAKQVMDIFGLAELQDPADFVNLLSVPLGSFQALNWDPKVSSDAFADFCTALVNDTSGPVSPAPQMLSPHSPQLIQTPSQQHIFTGSWQETTPSPSTTIEVPQVVINYAQYIKKSFVDECSNYNATVEECFGTSDYSRFYNSTELDDEISWTFQFCSTVS